MENIITTDKTTLGAKYLEDKKSVEFKLFSKNANRVQLCIFDKPQGEEPVMILEMKKSEDNIWHTFVKDYILNCKNKPVYYGYRLFGPNWEYSEELSENKKAGFKNIFDEKGNRFNPNKLAYDPYSRELSHNRSDIEEENNTSGLFRSGGEYYSIENYKQAPKSVFKFIDNKEISKTSIRPFASEIIGEVHIKDLTQTLDMPEKGTYKGASKAALKIKELGITMVEFLPLNEFDPKENGGNHWGYMPLGYFSLARKYAYDKTQGSLLNEFREMIDEFHKQDIKVCLDMVYNHTGEAGLVNNNPNDANLSSYALIDNSTYYKVYENGYYRSNSGCGNDFNASSQPVMDLIIDSIVFWVNQGVDAFRFDLAAALLENSCNCDEIYDNIDSLAAKLKEKLKEKGIHVVDNFTQSQDGVVLIAEPWTCGGRKCYHLGNFPDFWAEWNDISRDTIRRITLEPNKITPFQMREIIEGTPSRFNEVNKSINYISSHDGFTLYDLNSYTKKNPQTQGGSDWEVCGNYNDDELKRENGIKKQLAFLFLSHGIPMIQIGDILLHSKQGNNNSYNRDDYTNYLDWEKPLRENTLDNRIYTYIKNLIKFRKENPIFFDENFVKSLSYRYDNGKTAEFDNTGYWYNPSDKFFGVLIQGQKRIYIASSKSDEKMGIILPSNLESKMWYKCLDTTDIANLDFEPKEYIENKYILSPQALVIFMEK